MIRTTHCPYCEATRLHRWVADESGAVYWCLTCYRVHLPTRPEEECNGCRYRIPSRCLLVTAKADDDRTAPCAYRSEAI